MTTKEARRRHTRAERQSIMEDCRASGSSRRRFAKSRGVGYSTLCGWFKREGSAPRNESHGLAAVAAQAFVELAPDMNGPEESRRASFIVRIGADVAVEFFPGCDPSDVRCVLDIARSSARA